MKNTLQKYLTILAVLCASMVTVSAQTLDSNKLIELSKKFGESDVLKGIAMVKQIDIDTTSVEVLTNLRSHNVSEKMIEAINERKAKLNPQIKKIEINPNAPLLIVDAEKESAATKTPLNASVTLEAKSANSCPDTQGVYYHQASSLVKVEPFNPQPDIGKLKIMGVGSNWKFQGAEAPLKIQTSKAEFWICNMDVNLRNIALAVLKKHGGSREVEYQSLGSFGHGSTRDPKKFRAVNASRVSDSLIIVTIELEEGEYALDLIGIPQYDFSVKNGSAIASRE